VRDERQVGWCEQPKVTDESFDLIDKLKSILIL